MTRKDAAAVPSEPDPTQTAALFRRATAGDGDAEHRLFLSLEAFLVQASASHRLMRPLRRHTSPEDVAHEVWERCYRSRALDDFEDRGPGSLRAFLAVILDRTLHDHLRRAGRLKRQGDAAAIALDDVAVDPGANALCRDDTSPTGRARRAELTDIANEVLNPREREVWHALELEGLDAPEVARRQGSTASAVRGVMKRARAKLIERLGASYDERLERGPDAGS